MKTLKELMEELSKKDFRVLYTIESAMRDGRTPTLSRLYKRLPREFREELDEITLRLRNKKLIFTKYTRGGDVRMRLTYKGYELLGFQNLYKRGIIDDLRGPVGEGKEAYVYRGITPDGGLVCVKIYRISPRKFRKVKRYRDVDERFRVFISGEMAKREYETLEDLWPDVEVPRPIAFSRNMVVMERFDGVRLFKVNLEDPEGTFTRILNNVIEAAVKGYVHGDLSPYNILYSRSTGDIRIIDRPQAIPVGTQGRKVKLYEDLKHVVERFNKEYDLGIDLNALFDDVVNTIEEARKDAGGDQEEGEGTLKDSSM